jgi:hypothetical protein
MKGKTGVRFAEVCLFLSILVIIGIGVLLLIGYSLKDLYNGFLHDLHIFFHNPDFQLLIQYF